MQREFIMELHLLMISALAGREAKEKCNTPPPPSPSSTQVSRPGAVETRPSCLQRQYEIKLPSIIHPLFSLNSPPPSLWSSSCSLARQLYDSHAASPIQDTSVRYVWRTCAVHFRNTVTLMLEVIVKVRISNWPFFFFKGRHLDTALVINIKWWLRSI